MEVIGKSISCFSQCLESNVGSLFKQSTAASNRHHTHPHDCTYIHCRCHELYSAYRSRHFSVVTCKEHNALKCVHVCRSIYTPQIDQLTSQPILIELSVKVKPLRAYLMLYLPVCPSVVANMSWGRNKSNATDRATIWHLPWHSHQGSVQWFCRPPYCFMKTQMLPLPSNNQCYFFKTSGKLQHSMKYKVFPYAYCEILLV